MRRSRIPRRVARDLKASRPCCDRERDVMPRRSAGYCGLLPRYRVRGR
ncbi:hypothetical protein SFR_2220 [Streptomyces sp. FR-008]|nr:hypothetical protein SFR_2220 [Streptomyces sp. FR-008]